MPQIRGSCGHLKGSYGNHSSCLNCSGCFRSNCCLVCHSWSNSTWSLVGRRRRFRDRQMGKKKDAKVKEGKNSTSRNSSKMLRFCLCHHRGVSGYAGTPRFPAVEAHTEPQVLVRRDGRPIVPSPPDPKPVIWLVSMVFRLRPRTLRLRF